MNRRHFIGTTIATLILKDTFSFGTALKRDLSFGIISDVHKDLMPDADDRLEAFIQEANKRKVDFIIQLGDFCFGEEKNNEFLAIWNKFERDKYHVLGNHDMDRNTKKEIMAYWQMPKPYYSFDKNGIHFIVLDANFIQEGGNFIDYANANFYIDASKRTFIHPDQINWLKKVLEQTNSPTILCSHQSLWHPKWGVKNGAEIRAILKENKSKIICCLNGNNHIDLHKTLDGIDYIDINSASYQWVGDEFSSNKRFPKELYKKFPNLPHIAGYTSPLFCFAKVSTEGTFTVEGRQSSWMKPSPFDLGKKPAQRSEKRLSTHISDRSIRF